MKDDFRFGECLIQPQLNLIKTPHDSIRVEPKVMELLVYLAKHREEVVPKERVIQTVWPDSYVADDVLTSAVWKLRRAFGDDPKDPRYIETIPKAGYRLIAPVSYGEDELGSQSNGLERSRRGDTKASPSEPGGSSEESSSGRKRRPARVAASSLTAAIALILAIWYWPVTEKSLSKTQGSKPSVAVLYFQNLSQDREGDIWAAGMTEAVITDLAKLGRLAVKLRLQVLPFKDQTPDLETIRKELGVDVFVDTSLQKIGSELRIHTKLIDADSGDHLWAQTYERSIREIFQVQDEISQAIATALGVELAGVQRSVLMARPTQNSAAFEYASEGIYHLDREEYDKALIAFDSALKLDPGYALAHYYKGRTYQTMEAYESAMESYNQALPRADQFSRKLWEWKSPNLGTRWSYSKQHQIAIAASTDFEKQSIQLTALDLTRKQVAWKQSPPGADVRLLTPDPELQSTPYDTTLLVETRPDPAPFRGGVGDPREATLHAYDIMRGDLLFRKTFRPAVATSRPLRIANGHAARHKAPILIHLASGGGGGEIHCLNPRTGRERWVFQWDGGLERPEPTAARGYSLFNYSWIVVDESGTDALLLPLITFRGNQKVWRYALLDLDKGTIIWEMDLPEPQQSVVHQDRIIAINPDDGLVSCTRLPDRTQIWSYQARAEITDWVGLAANDLLILQLAGGKLVAIETSDRLLDFGRIQWRVDLGDASYKFWSDQGYLGSSYFLPTRANLVKAQTLFAVSDEGSIHSLDLMTGELLGTVESELDEPRLYNLDGTVLARASTYLLRPDSSYGDIQWQVKRPITPVEVGQNRLISVNPELVSALDLEDGGLLWSYRPQSRVASRFWVSGGSPLFSVTAEERFVPLDDGLIEISIQENPEERIVSSKEVHSRLSECAVSLGDNETAEALLLQIVDMDPGHASAYWMLADIYRETDRRGEALRRVIDYHTVSRPGSPESARALERLREGGLLWRSDIDRIFTPVFSDGERLISGWKNEVGATGSRFKFDIFSLHKESGEVVWSRKLNYFTTCGLDERYLFSIHDTGGVRNLLKRKKVLSAIDKSTGESGWVVQLDCEGDLLPIPGIHENRVFSTCDSGVDQDRRRVLAFDTSSGQLVWERETKGHRGTLYGGHLVLVASAGVELLSAETGEHEWWFSTSDRKIASKSVFLEKDGEPDGRLVFMTEDNYFHCLDLNKRQELWSAPSPLSKRLNPRSAVGDTLIAVGPTGFTAFRYDPMKEGISIVWTTPMDLGQKQLFGMLDHDQAFYIPSRERSLLQLDSARPETGVPRTVIC